MANITIIYGSSTDNTSDVAKQIASKLSEHNVKLLDVCDATKDDFELAENLILGTSTWGLGDLQDDWEGNLSILEESKLSGKKVALFGCGDSNTYPDTFVDGIGILFEAAKNAGATIIGEVDTDGYPHSASRAEVDGKFVGLPLDDDFADENKERIANWIASISNQF